MTLVWLLLAALALFIELLTGTFYMLVICTALVCAGIAAWSGAELWAQAVVAAGLSVTLTAVIRQRFSGSLRRRYSFKTPSVGTPLHSGDDLDHGQIVVVDVWVNNRARVRYRGSDWDATLLPGYPPLAGPHAIESIKTNALQLRPVSKPNANLT